MTRHRRWKTLAAAFLPMALSPVLRTEERARRIEYPADLGPDTVDVSDYPPPLQKIYRENFLKTCAVCHSPARALNAPYLEIKDHERAALELEQPALFEDPKILMAGPHLWKHYIKRMKMRPPCCGVCPVMTDQSSKEIWEFLVYDGRARKTGAQAQSWRRHRQTLLDEFKTKFPDKYTELYSHNKEEHP